MKNHQNVITPNSQKIGQTSQQSEQPNEASIRRNDSSNGSRSGQRPSVHVIRKPEFSKAEQPFTKRIGQRSSSSNNNFQPKGVSQNTAAKTPSHAQKTAVHKPRPPSKSYGHQFQYPRLGAPPTSRESTPCYPQSTPNWPQNTPTLGQIEFPDQPQFTAAVKQPNSIWPYGDSNVAGAAPDTPITRIAPGSLISNEKKESEPTVEQLVATEKVSEEVSGAISNIAADQCSVRSVGASDAIGVNLNALVQQTGYQEGSPKAQTVPSSPLQTIQKMMVGEFRHRTDSHTMELPSGPDLALSCLKEFFKVDDGSRSMMALGRPAVSGNLETAFNCPDAYQRNLSAVEQGSRPMHLNKNLSSEQDLFKSPPFENDLGCSIPGESYFGDADVSNIDFEYHHINNSNPFEQPELYRWQSALGSSGNRAQDSGLDLPAAVDLKPTNQRPQKTPHKNRRRTRKQQRKGQKAQENAKYQKQTNINNFELLGANIRSEDLEIRKPPVAKLNKPHEAQQLCGGQESFGKVAKPRRKKRRGVGYNKSPDKIQRRPSTEECISTIPSKAEGNVTPVSAQFSLQDQPSKRQCTEQPDCFQGEFGHR